ncbi:hypothetical protein KTO58_04575 [Chitinophaga pendula]|uniref:hypothetical protein n=1 Tax=Chitinophaga TaxID=79328 RepID=UPI000BAF376E|nr:MULTISPECIES: hypothetical protein [Chitinophaga]ASZ13914.1 hypothetical protein CK934_24620 [Chitinophaga sp. MD30]UCJ08468.1 hypothetical protein KTO58_04575 [Chitinophaga pendula]
MTTIEALITAARRYCKDNFNYWANRYAKERTGSNYPVYSYSDGDYDLFPRYNVLDAILAEVEKLVGIQDTDLAACRQQLIEIGLTAQSALTTGKNNQIEKAAILQEREKFVKYISDVTLGELGLIDPLPHRRRLHMNEQAIVASQLHNYWNYDGNYWDPIEPKCPSEILFIAAAYLTEDDHNFIRTMAVSDNMYLLEVTEEGAYTEIAPGEINLASYETFYCPEDYSWCIYISHEATITFAGTALLSSLRKYFASRIDLFGQWPSYS